MKRTSWLSLVFWAQKGRSRQEKSLSLESGARFFKNVRPVGRRGHFREDAEDTKREDSAQSFRTARVDQNARFKPCVFESDDPKEIE